MSLILKFTPKSYKNKILLLVLSLVFFMLIIFSSVIYYNIESILQGNDFKSNQRNLSLIKYNVENMDSNISTLANALYYNEDTQYLIDNKDSDMLNTFMKMNNMNKVVVSNNFLKDIYFYNNYKKLFYSTQKGIFNKSEELDALDKEYKIIPIRKLLTVKQKDTDEKGNPKYKFYYVINGGADGSDKFDSDLIFDIKTEWLFDSLKIVNQFDLTKNDNIFLVSDKGEFIGAHSYDSKFEKLISNRLRENKLNNKSSSFSFFKEKIQGEVYLITYIIIEKTGWGIIRVQPYNEVYKYIKTVRIIIVVTTLLALLMAYIFAVNISKKIYRPVGDLVNNIIVRENRGGERVKDQIEFLNDVYNLSSEKLKDYERDKDENGEIVNLFYLRSIISNSANFSKEDMGKLLVNKLEVSFEKDILLGIIRIDNYRAFYEKYNSKDRELFKYDVECIAKEIISPTFNIITIDMEQDKIIFLININVEDQNWKKALLGNLMEAQKNILHYLPFTVSIALSENINDFRLLSKQYGTTLSNSNYRFLFGAQCIITKDKIIPNLANTTFQYPFEIEKELLKQIRVGKTEKASLYLRQIFAETEKMNYNNITLSMAYLLNSLKSVIDEVNQVRLDPIIIEYNEYNQYLYEMECKEELYQKYLELISKIEVITNEDKSLAKRHAYMIDAIKDIIGKNYFNSNICLTYVADNLKMSSRHVGKIFKENVGMSVAEYINDIRIIKAAELLVSTNISVVDIMGKIGIEYESQFYKLFKTKYGTTPKEYSLKKTIEK